MIREVSDHLFCIPVPLPGNPLKELNAYLIQTGDRCLLIDTGFRMAACRQALESGLDRLGVDRNCMDIFLTHAHADHSGLAPELIAPGGRIMVGEADISRLDVSARSRVWRERDLAFEKEGYLRRVCPAEEESPGRRYACVSYEGYVPLREGDVLNYGGNWTCISTPGHSPGHMCLYQKETRTLFLGDHVLFDITPNITSWVGFPDALGMYLNSLTKMEGCEAETLLPGHRTMTGDLNARIRQLKEHHRLRLEEVRTLVEERPGQTAYELAGRMTWNIRCRSWADFPESQRTYAVGEALAHLEHLVAEGQLEKRMEETVYRYYVGRTME